MKNVCTREARSFDKCVTGLFAALERPRPHLDFFLHHIYDFFQQISVFFPTNLDFFFVKSGFLSENRFFHKLRLINSGGPLSGHFLPIIRLYFQKWPQTTRRVLETATLHCTKFWLLFSRFHDHNCVRLVFIFTASRLGGGPR